MITELLFRETLTTRINMATSDFLKAALEKKNAAKITGGKKSKGADTKGIIGNQVTTNKPAKKSAGRGR